MHLDTHVVVWLHEGNLERFPVSVRRLLDAEPLLVSPMVELELALLHEIGRIAPTPSAVLAELGRTIGLGISELSFALVVTAAASLTWTRDPFDRLICGQAIADGRTLITRDRRIREHLPAARWD